MSSWNVQTALAIVVPNNLNSWIQECRSQHDSAYGRWPPHINLLFPFIDEKDFAAQVPRLKSAVGVLSRFRLKLHTTGFFKHGPRKWVLILKPEESVPGSLDRLQSTVFKLYPQCSKQRDVGGGNFVPHVTLGQFETQAAMEAKMAELASKPAVEFELDFISMLARTKTDPFELKHKIELGTSLPLTASSDDSLVLGDLFSSGSIPIEAASLPSVVKETKVPKTKKPSPARRSAKTASESFPSPSEDTPMFGLFDDNFVASSSFSPESEKSESSPSSASGTKRTSIKKKPEGGGFKSSYYKDKPSPLTREKTVPKSKSPLNVSPAKASPKSSSNLSPSFNSPSSKYAIPIQAPTAPQFSAFATSITAPTVAPSMMTLTPPAPYSPSISLDSSKMTTSASPSMTTRSASNLMSGFSPSKPPAPIIIGSPIKVEQKPKTSSYYSGERKTTIGRKTTEAGKDQVGASSSSFLHSSDLTFEASSLSISAEFAKPDPSPPVVTHKVIATKVKDPSVLAPELEALVGRVLQWLITLDSLKRPKTRTKLANAITKMCTIISTGITAQEALQELISSGHLTLNGDKVTLLKKSTKDVQRYNLTLSGNYSFSSDKDAAMDRCITWIQDPDNRPRTKPALLNTLKQLVQIKKPVNPSTIIQNLIETGHLTALQDEKGAEFLEYHL